MPAVVVLGADVLQGVVLEAIADLLQYAGFAGGRFEGSAEISVCSIRDYAAVSLTLDEAI